MTSATFISTAIGAILCVFYVAAKNKAYDLKELALKTAVSLCFVITAVLANKANPASVYVFVLAGLLFGLAGDVVLDLKFIDRKREDLWTYAGFISFAIGHVFYMTGLYTHYGKTVHLRYTIIAFAVSLIISIVVVNFGHILGNDYGRQKAVVGFYSFFLFSMTLMAGLYAFAFGWKEAFLNIFFAGGVLFCISDLVLSGTYYGKGHETLKDFILNYLTYYSAQFLIALALLAA